MDWMPNIEVVKLRIIEEYRLIPSERPDWVKYKFPNEMLYWQQVKITQF